MATFDGLEALGLGGMGTEDPFKKAETEKPVVKKPEAPKKQEPVAEEKDLLFDKSYECPVCDKGFTAKTVRTGKVHTERIDYDLRPVYDLLDQVKYDVVACPYCGYAVLARYHGSVSDKQSKILREAIASKFRPQEWGKDIYSYDEAKVRYQLAMANAMARNAKNSEKAYLCLKMAWLARGEKEALTAAGEPADKIREAEAAELKHMGQALEGFEQARQNENFPIAGMDDKTLDYLMAALYMSQRRYQESARFLGSILVSKNISRNLRTKAEDLKAMLMETIKKNDPLNH